MMKFFKSLSMRFGVRFAVGGMLYRPRDQWPSPLPPEMCYGNLPPPNRWSADQVPMQNRTVKRTVDFKGNKRVHIKSSKMDFDRRFCTFQVTVRATHPQLMPLIIVYKGKPSKEDPRIPKWGPLKKESENYDPRVIVLWDEIAYLRKPGVRFWQDLWLEKSRCEGRRMLQLDGYKAIIKPKVINKFKRHDVQVTVNPGECTDANTSVVDAEIGETLKKKIDAKITEVRRENTELNDRIETEGIHMLRTELTRWAADAWEEIINSDIIPKAFKKCGLCNDVYGREGHLIECQHLETYEAPGPDFQWMDEAYTEEQIEEFYMKEYNFLSGKKKRKKLDRQKKTYQRNLHACKKDFQKNPRSVISVIFNVALMPDLTVHHV